MQSKQKNGTAVATPVPTLEPRMLTVKDAARYLACTEWCVRTLVWEKKISHLVFGKRYVFDKADLDRFIESEKVRAA